MRLKNSESFFLFLCLFLVFCGFRGVFFFGIHLRDSFVLCRHYTKEETGLRGVEWFLQGQRATVGERFLLSFYTQVNRIFLQVPELFFPLPFSFPLGRQPIST